MTTTSSPTTPASTARHPDLAAARARNESTWRAAASALHAGDVEELLDHWTADARYRLAYPVAGFPSVVRGRDDLRAVFSAMTGVAQHVGVDEVTFHQTDDPDVAVVEERMTADLAGGGRYINRIVMRVLFRDNKIHDLLEYGSETAQSALARTMGAHTMGGAR